MKTISDKINMIEQLCEKYNVADLYVFGSVLTDNFSAESDIDFLVDFRKINLDQYADNYFDLKFSLESLFGRKVDLLEKKAIKNSFLLESIMGRKKHVYGHGN